MSSIMGIVLTFIFSLIINITTAFSPEFCVSEEDAAKNNKYVDPSTWLFILVPVIIIFALGCIRFFYQLLGREDRRNKVVFHDLWRPIRIVGICSQLLFCAIAGPSTLWIKIYITSAIISFALFDECKKIGTQEIKDMFKLGENIEENRFVVLLRSFFQSIIDFIK
ncbi:hypothetical protein C1645_882012 [Glomus cerebriforme]|uniref:Uncharacterized protein n=1 Tax=Glomus cerebriforme TaxID=658196 RepID=A0A397S9N5_9GLOM|nr:hypothetical protein C1645_882012 [Glomus cerebriforme]